MRTTPFGYIRLDEGAEVPSPMAMRVVAPGRHHLRVRFPAFGGATGDVDLDVIAGERRVGAISPSDPH